MGIFISSIEATLPHIGTFNTVPPSPSPLTCKNLLLSKTVFFDFFILMIIYNYCIFGNLIVVNKA